MAMDESQLTRLALLVRFAKELDSQSPEPLGALATLTARMLCLDVCGIEFDLGYYMDGPTLHSVYLPAYVSIYLCNKEFVDTLVRQVEFTDWASNTVGATKRLLEPPSSIQAVVWLELVSSLCFVAGVRYGETGEFSAITDLRAHPRKVAMINEIVLRGNERLAEHGQYVALAWERIWWCTTPMYTPREPFQ